MMVITISTARKNFCNAFNLLAITVIIINVIIITSRMCGCSVNLEIAGSVFYWVMSMGGFEPSISAKKPAS